MTKVYVPRERRLGEGRVAATPETVRALVADGLAVEVEPGAGAAAGFTDDAYTEAGARLVDRGDDWGTEVVLLVRVPPAGDLPRLAAGGLLLGFLEPYGEDGIPEALAAAGARGLALERLPRTTRAQPMDALSSQASLTGYKAAVLAAAELDRYFPMLMTAAGTVPAARVVVLGAGVAGLQALATARRLGAVVEVSDVREAVREQVESLGGRFIDLPELPAGDGGGGYAREMGPEFLARQRELVAERVAHADVVITSALIPGRPAPQLLTRAMVERMRPGAVIVDLAGSQGGNCELARVDERVEHQGVTILAPANLAATTPRDASILYARNVLALLRAVLVDGHPAPDPADELVAATLLPPPAGPAPSGEEDS